MKSTPLTDYLIFHLQNTLFTFKQFQQIHTQILTSHHLHTYPLLSTFISSFYQSSHLNYVLLFLQKNLPVPSYSLWNSLIRAFTTGSSSSLSSTVRQDYVTIYNIMRHADINPDNTTFSIVLRASAAVLDRKIGECFHCEIIKFGFGVDMFLQTGLLDFYSKVGELGCAKKVFDEMPERDVVVCNAMITALGMHGCVSDARKLFDEMWEKTSSSWNTMISCYCKVGDIGSARVIFDCNPVRNVISWNAMIDGYCKLNQMRIAEELFDGMGFLRNTVTWNTMISGYVRNGEFGRAISMFRSMQVENVKATVETMVSLLSACAHLGALDMGSWVHAHIRRNAVKIDEYLGNALVDMYCKCGSLESALDVFHSLSLKSVFCWSSIIVGLGMHGHGQEAIDAFVAMNKEGIKPDRVTFIGLLSGCSHSGLISEGRQYFNQMLGVYEIQPGVEHFGCMVDLLGRSGFLEEALDLIRSMPMSPNAAVWGSLLRACQLHKDTKICEQVTKHLLNLDPGDNGNYVFLSNVYASVNRWNDVETCRKLMDERGISKIPGCSSIEVDNVVHEFVAGDTSHPQYTHINRFLDEVAKNLRIRGHQPDIDAVLHDVNEEEKETAIRYHSEKLAVAFGIMSTPEGKSLRVVKNLRACSDCHTFMKHMSHLFKREIIVRDRNRFHHFREGACSCRDYW